MTIIRVEENGIEFFTDAATGESGLSVSGLALLCGVEQQSISRFLASEDIWSKIEILKPWAGRTFNLTAEYRKRGGLVRILRAEFCADVILHFAIAEQNQVAQLSLRKFNQAGITTWIHRITGYGLSQVQEPKLDRLGQLEYRVACLESQIQQQKPEQTLLFETFSADDFGHRSDSPMVYRLTTIKKLKVFVGIYEAFEQFWAESGLQKLHAHMEFCHRYNNREFDFPDEVYRYFPSLSRTQIHLHARHCRKNNLLPLSTMNKKLDKGGK